MSLLFVSADVFRFHCLVLVCSGITQYIILFYGKLDLRCAHIVYKIWNAFHYVSQCIYCCLEKICNEAFFLRNLFCLWHLLTSKEENPTYYLVYFHATIDAKVEELAKYFFYTILKLEAWNIP